MRRTNDNSSGGMIVHVRPVPVMTLLMTSDDMHCKPTVSWLGRSHLPAIIALLGSGGCAVGRVLRGVLHGLRFTTILVM